MATDLFGSGSDWLGDFGTSGTDALGDLLRDTPLLGGFADTGSNFLDPWLDERYL